MSKHTFLRSAIATMATLIATGLPPTSPAHAVDSAAGPGRLAAAQDVINTFRNRATGRCLNDSGAGLRSFACNGLDFQRWY